MTISLNPRAPKPDHENAPREPTGPIAADSLAAESLDNKGAFSENSGAAAQSVRGDQSTFANTDTSGARKLEPAASGAERERQQYTGGGADKSVQGTSGLKLDAAGKPDFDGVHNKDGYYGGANNGGNNQRGQADTAPSYVTNVTGAARSDGTYKPKGKNLEDADETGSIPKPKTFTGNVGGQYDPGRVAENEFASRNTDLKTELSSAGVEGGAQRQKQSTEEGGVGVQGGQYGVLESERA
ncbi:hypothetical protein ABEF93_005483 [Exophiala dermatitidis]